MIYYFMNLLYSVIWIIFSFILFVHSFHHRHCHIVSMTGASRSRLSKVVTKAITSTTKRSSTSTAATAAIAITSTTKVTRGKRTSTKEEPSPVPVLKKTKATPVVNPSSSSSGKWLMKSEPSEFSIDHLRTDHTGQWDGVRNYQARNFMQEMHIGDLAYFYHSNCDVPGIYGLMRIHQLAFPDHTAIDKQSKYYDNRIKDITKNPWCCVGVEFVEKYEHPLTLQEIKSLDLDDCRLVAKGNRLSLFPLSVEHFQLLENEIKKRN